MTRIFTAIGLMSGTSMDGIDVALVRTDGEAVVECLQSSSAPYDEDVRDLIVSAVRDATGLSDRMDRRGKLHEAEQRITSAHAEAIEGFLAENSLAHRDIDVIGFHGQTVLHRPEERLTVQIGDGAALSRDIGIDVMADMRAADVAAGGQGAPLVPVFHRALAAAHGIELPVAFLNVGGVANVTCINGHEEILAFDTGPGNGLLDDWSALHTGSPMDIDGKLADAGQVDDQCLDRLLTHPYFDIAPPKSLDRADFNYDAVSSLSAEDGAATLTAFSARAVAAAERFLPAVPKTWIVCGGGRRNPSLMSALDECLSGDIVNCDALGFDGDAIEAQAFAYLAVRCLKGQPITFPGTTGVGQPMTGGVHFFPTQAA